MDVPTSAATDVDPFSILIASFLDDLSESARESRRACFVTQAAVAC